jgi:signal transduction histidine kinase
VAIEIVAFPDTVLTVVSDHGDGFPDDFRAVAFDRFSRGDPARGGSGSGLGLAIAKGVVDAHGGEIWIGEGPGGDVRFSLPRGTLHASAHS